MPDTTLHPGRPGRGYDPTQSFTNLQWYMYHQNNIAYFAAFAATDTTLDEAVARIRQFVDALPHVLDGYRGGTAQREVSDEILRRLISIETVPSFEGFPDNWLNSDPHVYDTPELPYFRVRLARLEDGPDALGRRSFLIVRLSHAFAEGADSALLSRSQNAAHPKVVAKDRVPVGTALLARVVAGLAGLMQLVVARLWTPHPGRIVLVTRAYPRKAFFALARQLGVNQRALFAALTAHAVADGATPKSKQRLTTTYSTIDTAGGQSRDSFMRMRMRFARFDNHADFAAFARGIETAFVSGEAKESGFNAEMNAAAIGFHRRFSRMAPMLYGPKLFNFMPYDLVFGLIPPHRLGGPLVRGVIEPVYAGALVPGIVGCVVVPGREQITFNFSFLESEAGRIAAFDEMVAMLIGGLETPSPAEPPAH